MPNARRDSLYLMLLGTVVFILFGVGLTVAAHSRTADFKAVYFPARTLLSNRDPYQVSEVNAVYQANRAGLPQENEKIRQIATWGIYPPSALFLALPFALLPWKAAASFWIVLILVGFIAASWLIWNLCADEAPLLAGALIGFLLANSMLLPSSGNVAGVAISLCTIAVWCFLREKLVLPGVLCLALALAFKPHDAGPVWLCLLLAGPVFRKRALQALLATVALSVPGLLWVERISPHWLGEMSANIAAFALRGGQADPSALSSAAHGLDMVVTLQTVFSRFNDNPRFYNLATYILCGSLLLAWAWFLVRRRNGSATVRLGLAVIVPLSMLPVYHRQLDCALLLLVVPACVSLMKQGGAPGRFALPFTWAAFIFTGTLYWVSFFVVCNAVRIPERLGWLRADAEVFPQPLILLAAGVFYLWALAHSARAPLPDTQASGQI